MPPYWLETGGTADLKMMKYDVCLSLFQLQKEKRGKGEIYIYTLSLEGEIYRA